MSQPKLQKEVHQQPRTTSHAAVPPSGTPVGEGLLAVLSTSADSDDCFEMLVFSSVPAASPVCSATVESGGMLSPWVNMLQLKTQSCSRDKSPKLAP